MWHNTYGITHLQLGLELLNLVLESFHSLSALAACSAQVHGSLTAEGVYGAGPAQHPNLASALPTETRGAHGDAETLLLQNVVPLKGRLPVPTL